METALSIDNLRDTELRLGLPGINVVGSEKSRVTKGSKRALSEDETQSCAKSKSFEEVYDDLSGLETPMTKAQVIGWPPIRSYRKNLLLVQAQAAVNGTGLYVKVSMDGAPYLRKIDLKVYKGYKELREALDKMFKCFSLGELPGKEGGSGCDYSITYEDKDGDLMLVGDVPWEMFVSSCKRLRIMKGCEAKGLQSNH
ncbi:auxin-induced protein 22D-like [Zingiber officinale]|uniref:auxin-induced protein 22D-like n=1 Tax=Zingiber officinale TaxID=94328 RepID=UPI001C4BBCFF|nr:auxin-induced protein 22D-like [Zingiber officinale]